MRFANIPYSGSNTSTNFAYIPASQVLAVSLIAVFSDGAAVGTLKFQASNDFATAGDLSTGFAPTNWADISASVSVTAGGTVIIPKTEVCYNWLRVVWTRSAGAGTLAINVATMGY